ncbi:SpoIIE family protein phosphatase [Actinokineospora auranticolor]|uniref:GAF domain-containing protein n=1 Tax=Actinokineospora auranticolor TaxID=155976 RepID=A0A2S6GIN8_9PSEU|nr:SpoIIE family protein phosphatase [Actinokineospora auranticolor]PPK65053.1 GAF domain-containing protein [Actinokineospora auranticolor]
MSTRREVPARGGLADPARLAALRDTGLSEMSDLGMERFARLVASVVGTPVALVSLVEADRQMFPGMVGLDDPWATARSTPLSHSLCSQVVLSGEPLVLPDTRADDHWCANPAIDDLGVAAYAGMPLVDVDGHVLGSLCAIDTSPRSWTEAQLRDLADLAAACAAELRLRIVSHRAEQAHRRADEYAAQVRAALTRSELLLRAADDLADTTGLVKVRDRVRDLVTSDLKPSYVGLVLVEGRRLRRVVDHTGTVPVEAVYESYDLDDNWPTARAIRDNATVVIQDTAGLVDGGYPAEVVAAFEEMNLRTAICVPLPGTRGPLGALAVCWDTPHELDLLERSVVTALAGYTARAVERARFLDDRVSTAHQLQQAMLTDLPTTEGIETAALYRPATTDELVGGDWYDAYPLPATTTLPAGLAVTIGDITGHDIHAATLMGQLRSMIRQADLDHPGAGPATTVTAVENANQALDLRASGSLVHCHLRPRPDRGWDLTWTNVGHPSPLLRCPSGRVTQLQHSGRIIHPDLPTPARTDHHTVLPPGSTLLLYTDGLTDRRGHDIDDATTHTLHLLAGHTGTMPTLLDTLVARLGGTAPEDDIALIAVHIPPPTT